MAGFQTASLEMTPYHFFQKNINSQPHLLRKVHIVVHSCNSQRLKVKYTIQGHTTSYGYQGGTRSPIYNVPVCSEQHAHKMTSCRMTRDGHLFTFWELRAQEQVCFLGFLDNGSDGNCGNGNSTRLKQGCIKCCGSVLMKK